MAWELKNRMWMQFFWWTILFYIIFPFVFKTVFPQSSFYDNKVPFTKPFEAFPSWHKVKDLVFMKWTKDHRFKNKWILKLIFFFSSNYGRNRKWNNWRGRFWLRTSWSQNWNCQQGLEAFAGFGWSIACAFHAWKSDSI